MSTRYRQHSTLGLRAKLRGQAATQIAQAPSTCWSHARGCTNAGTPWMHRQAAIRLLILIQLQFRAQAADACTARQSWEKIAARSQQGQVSNCGFAAARRRVRKTRKRKARSCYTAAKAATAPRGTSLHLLDHVCLLPSARACASCASVCSKAATAALLSLSARTPPAGQLACLNSLRPSTTFHTLQTPLLPSLYRPSSPPSPYPLLPLKDDRRGAT